MAVRSSDVQWPHLMRWLPRRDHLFKPGCFPWPTDVYDRLESVLAEWDGLNPHGIAAKRSAFRNGRAHALMDSRSELLIGYLLGKADLQFGCPPFPDFVCSSGCDAGIEATTRRINDLEMLESKVRELDNPHGHRFKVSGGRVVMRKALIRSIVDSVAMIMQRQEGGVYHIDDPPLTVHVSRVVDSFIDFDEFIVTSRQQLDECIQELPRIIAQKCGQAEATVLPVPRPLVLFVDVSRFGAFGAGIGPFAIGDSWLHVKATLQDMDCRCFDAIVVAISNLQTNGFAGVMHRSSSLLPEYVTSLDCLNAALLMRQDPPPTMDYMRKRLEDLESGG